MINRETNELWQSFYPGTTRDSMQPRTPVSGTYVGVIAPLCDDSDTRAEIELNDFYRTGVL